MAPTEESGCRGAPRPACHDSPRVVGMRPLLIRISRGRMHIPRIDIIYAPAP
jgi:hypothetical protein